MIPIPPAVVEFLAAESAAPGATATIARLRAAADIVTTAASSGVSFESVAVSPTTITLHAARPMSLDLVIAALGIRVGADFTVTGSPWGRSRMVVGSIGRTDIALIGAPAMPGASTIETTERAA